MIYGNPNIDPEAKIAAEAVIVGDVTIGRRSSVWYCSVIRGDEAPVTIGCETNIQENCTVHVSREMPAVIGDRVTVGHNAVLHSCTVGDGSLIGMGAIVLDKAVIGKNWFAGDGQSRPYPAVFDRTGEGGSEPECRRVSGVIRKIEL